MRTRLQATKFSFQSFCSNQLPPLHWTLPRASTVLRIILVQTQVNLQNHLETFRSKPPVPEASFSKVTYSATSMTLLGSPQ